MRLSAAKVSEVYKKYPIEKMWFQVEKYEKYLQSKNDIKRPLGPFNRVMSNLLFFMKYGKTLKPSNYSENYIRIDSKI